MVLCEGSKLAASLRAEKHGKAMSVFCSGCTQCKGPQETQPGVLSRQTAEDEAFEELETTAPKHWQITGTHRLCCAHHEQNEMLRELGNSSRSYDLEAAKDERPAFCCLDCTPNKGVEEGTPRDDSFEVPGAQEPGTIVLENDLQAAINVRYDGEVKVLYPRMRHRITNCTSEMVMEVSLRDDPSVTGTCQISGTSTAIRVSDGFGSFGSSAAEFLLKEFQEIRRQRQLPGKRERMQEKEFTHKTDRPLLLLLPSLCFCALLFSGGLVICIFVESQDEAAVVGACMALMVGVICVAGWCIGCGCAGLHTDRNWLCCLVSCAAITWPFLAFACLVVALVRYGLAGFWWTTLVVGGSCCCLCFCGCYGLQKTEMELAELDPFAYRERFLTQEKGEFATNSIEYKGRVLPGKGQKCVCSWPGKYESAWDDLVRGSRKGHVSAAVVFLPQGSRDFGKHDTIPEQEHLEGDCWCIPLYGVKKQWGCKWWTKWIENIETAVEQEAQLEVYFFAGMCGKGKAEHFRTVGSQNFKRETILKKRDYFMKSPEFRAVEQYLKRLRRDRRADSSSQYSRELDRLFLGSLSEEERNFMESSEGLGTSQKAEVAWLEWKGYAYTEVDVSTGFKTA